MEARLLLDVSFSELCDAIEAYNETVRREAHLRASHGLPASLAFLHDLACLHELNAPLLALTRAPLLAPLLDPHLRFYMMNWMLRSLIFICIAT